MNMPSNPTDNDLIRAYVDQTLEEPALSRFELRLLVEPALQDEVDLDIALRQGLRRHAQGIAPAPSVSAPTSSVTTLPQRSVMIPPRRSRHRQLQTIAASFFAGMVLPSLALIGMYQTSQHEADHTFAPRGNVPTLLIDPVRSATDNDVVLVVAPNSSLLLLQVPVYPQDASDRYSLRIERENGEPVAELEQLVPDADDLISALVPASSLPSGRYRLDLHSTHAGVTGEQRRIVLRVTAMG